MNHPLPLPAEHAAGRDDRTHRMLERMIGSEQASLALTHFVAARVEVHVSGSTLATNNGLLSAVAALNMLSRIVGTVELVVDGEVNALVTDALKAALERLKRIDTRPGRTVLVTHAERPPADVQPEVAFRLWLGAAGPSGAKPSDANTDVGVAFDGWACWLKRGALAGSSSVSRFPFGGLLAACFGIAEAFKTLVCACLPESQRAAWRERFTHSWRFNSWIMDRDSDQVSVMSNMEDRGAATLSLDTVLQVGAGAVGNASVLAFSAIGQAIGPLVVIDPKIVDEKNLNRCFFFTEDDIGRPKVEVLATIGGHHNLGIRGRQQLFASGMVGNRTVLLSTVDNNEVRHRMQEALPPVLVQGATGGTTVAVSVHNPGNGRSCLTCRHPDPLVGLPRLIPLSVDETSEVTGMSAGEVMSGLVGGKGEITDEVIARARERSEQVAESLQLARERGRDLCGAMGDLRDELGTIAGPREASLPFVSVLAGVLAAAEVVKVLLRPQSQDSVPVLDNVLVIDLARDYTRASNLSFKEPPRADCAFCQLRAGTIQLARRSSGL